ncbi:TPA: hypothetical protein DDZ86_01965 [Candidatus Dependentiae bacterium]|nr:MAG: hypothetical protein UW09_C0001G0245 [candidate division TM6 bacterium GW2011_GWF2_43_87]HBL98390.1 hypothetical protein [Candidatus Dependentiae bacterium]
MKFSNVCAFSSLFLSSLTFGMSDLSNNTTFSSLQSVKTTESEKSDNSAKSLQLPKNQRIKFPELAPIYLKRHNTDTSKLISPNSRAATISPQNNSNQFANQANSNLSDISGIGHLKSVESKIENAEQAVIDPEDTDNDALSESNPFPKANNMQLLINSLKINITKVIQGFIKLASPTKK